MGCVHGRELHGLLLAPLLGSALLVPLNSTTRKASQARDVRSPAVWEAVAGEEAHEGLTSIQVMVQVLQHGLRPEIPPHYPAPLAGLMQRCWQQDARLRCAELLGSGAGTHAVILEVPGKRCPALSRVVSAGSAQDGASGIPQLKSSSTAPPINPAPLLPCRPTAAEVATELNGMFKSLRGVPSQSRSEPMASTGAIQELVV